MSAFLDQAAACDHSVISPTYLETVLCETPYCTVEEIHCLLCNAFISKCGCHYNDGFSGWPMKRHRKLQRNRQERRMLAVVSKSQQGG